MSANAPSTPSSFVADSLAVGMLVMLAMTVIQRGLGFFRGLWFCRMLDDTVVGQWAMAYDFITMITPVMMLGIPGVLPRYAESFRGRGHLPAVIRRLAAVTLILGGSFVVAMLMLPDWFGWLVFLQPQSAALVHSVAIAALVIVVFNFVYQLVSALRQVRVASTMQFVQSLAFTVLGVGWLAYGGNLIGLVYGFVIATVIAIAPGLRSLGRGWQGLPASTQPLNATAMWRRLLPYAAALWAMNLLGNLFELSDRYMILHWMPGDQTATQAAVGQYHSGRIIPVLLMSLATMISGVMLPYLAADWESGRQDQVRQRLRQILFAVSVLFTVGAAVALMFAPWFFATMLQNRYGEGLQLMPLAFVFCIWISLATIGQDYLWVAERGNWVAAAISVGLVANVLLNWWLLPLWGLHGAVVATLIANGIVLLGLWWAMARCGYELDQTTFLVSILPATLLAGPATALLCVAVACAGCTQVRHWLIDARTWRPTKPAAAHQ